MTCFLAWSHRKVFYNMVLTQPVSDEDCDGWQQVVCTEINFSSIVGLWGHTNKLLLELSTVPDMFLASRTVRLHSSVKKRKAIDITGCQIRRVPYHFVSVSLSVRDLFSSSLIFSHNQVFPTFPCIILGFLYIIIYRTFGISCGSQAYSDSMHFFYKCSSP